MDAREIIDAIAVLNQVVRLNMERGRGDHNLVRGSRKLITDANEKISKLIKLLQ